MTDQPGRAARPGGAAGGRASTAARKHPATYREILGFVEYRAVFAASVLSWIGDYLAKVAITALVYQNTHSVLAAAATFAIGYLPWIAGGPVLAALAERYPYRRVLIFCDVVRMVLIGVLVIPGMPLPALLGLLFAAAMLTPPFEAARSAQLPQILPDDRYVVGLSLQNTMYQVTQICGYGFGGLLSAVNPRFALLVDAATFAASALLVWRFVKHRPAAYRKDKGRGRLLRETAEGFTMVFGHPVLRAIAIVVFSSVAFAILPEGLAAGWSNDLGGGSTAQGLIMAASPIGVTVGSVVVGRLMSPRTRQRMIRPLAVLLPLALIPALFRPPLWAVLVMVAVSGFAISLSLPANGLFVRVLPNGYRARAFGVMQGGLQLIQGAAVVLSGAAAKLFGVPRTVGVWSLVGLAVMGLMVVVWPSPARFDRAIAETERINAEQEAAAARDRDTERPGHSPDTPAVRPDGLDGAGPRRSDRDDEVLAVAEELAERDGIGDAGQIAGSRRGAM